MTGSGVRVCTAVRLHICFVSISICSMLPVSCPSGTSVALGQLHPSNDFKFAKNGSKGEREGNIFHRVMGLAITCTFLDAPSRGDNCLVHTEG